MGIERFPPEFKEEAVRQIVERGYPVAEVSVLNVRSSADLAIGGRVVHSVRCVEFLGAMTASILSNGRKHGAFGMAGGQAGQVGINRVVRSDGRVEELDHIGQTAMQPGDVFEIHTPGGGGYGVAG